MEHEPDKAYLTLGLKCVKAFLDIPDNEVPKFNSDDLVWSFGDCTGRAKGAVGQSCKRLGMTTDPGPIIQGYVDEFFQDARPSGEEVQASAPGSVGKDLPNEDSTRE